MDSVKWIGRHKLIILYALFIQGVPHRKSVRGQCRFRRTNFEVDEEEFVVFRSNAEVLMNSEI